MRSILERERAGGFAGLSGTHIDATLPITQHLLDVLVAQAGARRNLSGLTVTLRANHEIGVAVVKSVFGFDTRLAIDLRIRGPVDLGSDPRLYLVVARPSLTWTAISRLVIAAGLAPPGVEIGRDGVAIDLRVMASRAGVADLLSLVRTVGFDGEAGVLRVHAVVDVPEGGIGSSGAQATRVDGPARESAGAGAHLPSAETLLTEFRGARVSGRIAVSEALANETIAIALDAARRTGSGGDAAVAPAPSPAQPVARLDLHTLSGWVQQAGVRFQNGRIVLEPDVLIA